MHIVLGATGHVGSTVADTLLNQGEAVTVVTRDAQKAEKWRQKGARAAVVDVHDVEGLTRVFRQGKRLFLLNPPASPRTDTANEERKSVEAILAAVRDSGLEKIVAQSTYGARPSDRIGDLGVLYEMEQQLAKIPIPTSIIRAAYYMSNWDTALQTARQEGKVYTLYPLDFKSPMVAPDDSGRVAARLLSSPLTDVRLHHVEGPKRYSSADVAAAFATALGQPVQAVEIPRPQWLLILKDRGFSEAAAEFMAAMTIATIEDTYTVPDTPTRGGTTLEDYVRRLVDLSQA